MTELPDTDCTELPFGPASDEGPDFEIRCYYYDNSR